MKILIAEDDTTSRLLFAATLRKLGHTVTAIEDGRKAWEAWQKDEYPLLISDWMMPDIDGLQLCRMIRSEPGLQYTYIILLSALDSKGSYLEGMDAGRTISLPNRSMRNNWQPGCGSLNAYLACIKHCISRLRAII